MHRSDFLKLLKERLPELRTPVNQHEGLLHFEMDELRKFAQRAIAEGDRRSLEICLRLAEETYREGDKKLKDAIDVSFVEPLDFVAAHNAYGWAWEMMPKTLQRLYRAFHGDRKIPKPPG
jgi:hypothetical protein